MVQKLRSQVLWGSWVSWLPHRLWDSENVPLGSQAPESLELLQQGCFQGQGLDEAALSGWEPITGTGFLNPQLGKAVWGAACQKAQPWTRPV